MITNENVTHNGRLPTPQSINRLEFGANSRHSLTTGLAIKPNTIEIAYKYMYIKNTYYISN